MKFVMHTLCNKNRITNQTILKQSYACITWSKRSKKMTYPVQSMLIQINFAQVFQNLLHFIICLFNLYYYLFDSHIIRSNDLDITAIAIYSCNNFISFNTKDTVFKKNFLLIFLPFFDHFLFIYTDKRLKHRF